MASNFGGLFNKNGEASAFYSVELVESTDVRKRTHLLAPELFFKF